jgi:hypothetical protein
MLKIDRPYTTRHFLILISSLIINILCYVLIIIFSSELGLPNILFYKCIVSSIIAGCIACFISMCLFSKIANEIDKFIRFFTILSASICFVCLSIAFGVVFPVTIDRSVTTFLLEEIENTPNISKHDLKKRLINSYVECEDAIDRRMNEQLYSGTLITTNEELSQDNSTFTLSTRGKKLMQFFKLVADFYGISFTKRKMCSSSKL